MASRASSFPSSSPKVAFNALYSSITVRVNSLNIDHEQKPYLVFTISKLQSFAEPMTSLVAEFLVNPVIRQAQRIRTGSFNDNAAPESNPVHFQQQRSFSQPTPAHLRHETDAILEPDEALGLSRHVARESDPALSFSPQYHHLDSAAHATNLGRNPVNDAESSSALSDDPDSPTDRADSFFSAGRVTMTDHHLHGEPNAPVASQESISEENAPLPTSGIRKPLPIPEDDGMGEMRRRIFDIQSQDIPASEKARLMHLLFQEGYTKSHSQRLDDPVATLPDTITWQQPIAQGPLESLKFWQSTVGSSSSSEHFTLTEQDVRPTYAPCRPADPGDDERVSWDGEHYLEQTGDDYVEEAMESDPPFGCEHYMRNVKLQCSTCSRWYTCRFCHDKVEDHALIRKDTKNMLCMYCGTPQRANDTCVTCNASAASYYCGICKLWNNDPEKNIYHCEDCGICRIGRGLGKDFFHCKKCCACIAIYKENDHTCVERLMDCDCPICGDYMFTSPKPVCILKCGHSMHNDCYTEHMKNSYKCPICNKSITNMDYLFRNLGLAIEAQPMPSEFDEARANILCNDCSAKSQVKYHWLGLKCDVCQSYNTAQLQLIGVGLDGSQIANTPRPAGLPPARSSIEESQDIATGSTGARDIPRSSRRHSSSIMEASAGDVDRLNISDRTARSFSPVQGRPRHWTASSCQTPLEEEEVREDMIGFWSRVPRSITSDNEDDDTADSGAETESSSEEEEMEEDDDEDADEWEIFGHR